MSLFIIIRANKYNIFHFGWGFIIFKLCDTGNFIHILLHYLVINLNCQRFRDSGFEYIKFYVWGTLVIYIASFVIMVAEDFACDGFGMPLFLIWYFATFSLLLLAPPDSNSLNK